MRWTAVVAALACACSSQPGTSNPSDNPDGGGGSGSDPGTPTYGTTTTTPPGTGPYVTVPMFWNRDVSQSAKAATSDATIAALHAAGGFGGGRVQIDFSIDVLDASASTPMRTFTTTSDFYTPDCDHVQMPV